MSEGYSGLPPYYTASADPITVNLGLSLKGCDPIVAENFYLIDTAFGQGGTTVQVNGAIVNDPNFNNTIPAAPIGYSNVTWQVSGSNVSAYITTSGQTETWAGLTGDLTIAQVIPFDGPTVGTPDTGISRLGVNSLAFGNGLTGDITAMLTFGNMEVGAPLSTLSSTITGVDAGIGAVNNGMATVNTGSAAINNRRKTLNVYLEANMQQTGSPDYYGIQSDVNYLSNAYSAPGTGTMNAIGATAMATGSNAELEQLNCFRARLNITGNASVANMTSFLSYLPSIATGSTVTNYFGYIQDTPSGGGTVTNWCGLLSTDPNVGITVAYAYGAILGGRTAAIIGDIVTGGQPYSSQTFIGHGISNGGNMPFTLYDGWYSGTGSPNGVQAATPGSIASNQSGGAGTSFYIKESGSGNTGWVAVLTGSTVLPATFAATAHEWLNSYSATTGLFTATQPAFSDLSGSIAIGQTPLTTAGDLLYANGTPALARLAIGMAGYVLTVVAGEPAWAASSSGTVTSFSAGNLSPLFTTSVATSTTTPALTFSLSNAAGGTILGNAAGSAAGPSYTATPILGVNASVAGTLGLATSVASGATIVIQNLGALSAYNFNLPLTVGATGSLLTSQAGTTNAMTWTTQAALAVSWSSLVAATANLTLNNVANTTTFQQQTATTVAGTLWTWANTTTATVSTQLNSPQLVLSANYYTGSASAADTWSIGSAIGAGSNGTSTLTISHAGSTGHTQIALSALGNSFTEAAVTWGNLGTSWGLYQSTGGRLGFTANGSPIFLAYGTPALQFGSTVPHAWTSTTNPEGTADTGISRQAAGVVGIGTGASGSTAGNLGLNRVNLSGTDMAGTATVTAGNTTKAVAFSVNYTTTAAPIVVITPTSDPLAVGAPVGYWITYSGSAGAWTGFTVNIQTALTGNVTFNYICIGQA
jgi:hypothetical protein